MKYQLLFVIIIAYGLFQTPLEAESKEGVKGKILHFPAWQLGPFMRNIENPIIKPDTSIRFYCPMEKRQIKWMESDTFNPSSVVFKNKIYVFYRSEDNSSPYLGQRTSRIGLAESKDGVHFHYLQSPVLYPAEDEMKDYEWPGGCEDPRVAQTENGMYVMFYTSWNRHTPRLCIATSRDLRHWTKYGPAFARAYGEKFKDMASKSASIVTKLEHGKLLIEKVNGKYMMYWGEHMINIATSEDLINWFPEVNARGELKGVVYPRSGYFDSDLTECGPPAIITKRGILLLYNGKNSLDSSKCDPNYCKGTYSAGQVLFSLKDPDKVIRRSCRPFFVPQEAYEKSGQYKDGTVFVEGLTYFKKKWFLYYGCADSRVGVAICNSLLY